MSMFALSRSPIPLFLGSIPGIDPGPFDPGPLPGEPDPDVPPLDPDGDPLDPAVGVPGIDPGYPAPGIPGVPSPVFTSA